MSVYPILLCGSKIGKNLTVFYPPLKEIEVSMPAGLARELVKLDGTKSTEQLINKLAHKWDRESLEKLFVLLLGCGIMLNSHDLSNHVWQFGQNPTPWHEKISDPRALEMVRDTQLQQPTTQPEFEFTVTETSLTCALVARKSVRQFNGTAVTHTVLERLLWCAYGATKHSTTGVTRTVPSAGGLYPLVIHLTLFQPTDALPAGVYRVTSNSPGAVSLNCIDADTTPVLYSFFQQNAVRGSAGMLTVSSCFERSTAKYGNRAISYTVLEAGHVAQNIHLSAVHDSIATLEMGGFQEKMLASALQLESSWMPLTTVVFGNEAVNSNDKDLVKTPSDAIENIIDRIEMSPTTVSGYTTPFHMVFAEVAAGKEPEPWCSCGRSPDKSLAKLKATAEAIEWFACGCAPEHNLVSTSYEQIADRAIDPRIIARYADAQLDGSLGLKPFDPTALYEWVPAVSAATGKESLVLADFVYFPYKPPHGLRYAYGNSSGTAAHTIKELAENSALLELAERDAFMIHWFNKLTPPRVAINSLPSEIQTRIARIEEHGFQVFVADMSLDLTPVAHVGIVRLSDNFFCCSAASDFDFLNALDRTLMEAEASVYCRLRDGTSYVPQIRPEQVVNVDDHAGLYQNRAFLRRAAFLLGTETATKTLREVQTVSRPSDREKLIGHLSKMSLEPSFVDLSVRDPLVQATGFHVVKAIVPGLVPMTFGYNKEPVKLDRIMSVPVRLGLLMRPTRFNRLNRLPHPYN
jgi:ribosomal protein S12 methylthiotransferase accessory factor